jgi:hypothetical protein
MESSEVKADSVLLITFSPLEKARPRGSLLMLDAIYKHDFRGGDTNVVWL